MQTLTLHGGNFVTRTFEIILSVPCTLKHRGFFDSRQLQIVVWSRTNELNISLVPDRLT